LEEFVGAFVVIDLEEETDDGFGSLLALVEF
jgi:hypothetical protein